MPNPELTAGRPGGLARSPSAQGREAARRRTAASPVLAGLHGPVWLFFLAYLLLAAVMHAYGYVDYVGKDNDDVMRLVQVRDLLAGQGWYDMVQYRLGLEGGTLMHWSRLIDLPIANLVLFFSLFLDQPMAEAAALFVWPILTVVPVFYALALGGRNFGDRTSAVLALVAAFLFVVGSNRFRPGSIDHHNVQLAVIATIAACLTVPGIRPFTFAVAGVAAALAIAIGAETTPHIAVAAAIVAALWAWRGEPARAAAAAFGFAMAAALTVFFFLTVPPARYGTVACDALSTGFYTLGVVGAGGLFLAASLLSWAPRSLRLASLVLLAAAVGGLALVIAPQCLGNPLADLDPLLVSMWLSAVTEAQPVWTEIRIAPWTAAGYYLVPLIAIGLCLVRIGQRRQADVHLVLLALIAVSTLIAFVQVRGAVFANLLSAFPLAAWVAERRKAAHADPKNTKKGLAFLGAALASLPLVWMFGGVVAEMGYNRIAGVQGVASDAVGPSCTDAEAMAPLAAEPRGVVAAASNLGAHILRFTGHRSLSGPYHRNQGGMLTELQIGMGSPSDALQFLRGAGVTVLAFCERDPQVVEIAAAAPDGLYAALSKGSVPDYLELVPATAGSPLRLYRVRPAPAG